MIRAFLMSFALGLLLISIAHNSYQIKLSVEHCEQLIQQIYQSAYILGDEDYE